MGRVRTLPDQLHQPPMQPWTVDDPPRIVRELISWYVHDRLSGQDLLDWAGTKGMSAKRAKELIKDPRVLELLDRELRLSNAGPLRVQAVLDMLYNRAVIREDVQAAKLYLQAVDRLSVRTQMDVVITDARSLSDEQLHAELQRTLRLLEDRAGIEPEILDAEVVELEPSTGG